MASIRSPSLASSYKFLLFSGFSRSLEIFYGSEISHGKFLGLNFFGPGIFWVLFEALRIFFQFFIFPSFDRPCHHLCHLNPEKPPPPAPVRRAFNKHFAASSKGASFEGGRLIEHLRLFFAIYKRFHMNFLRRSRILDQLTS